MVGGGATLSVHADGRALDLMVDEGGAELGYTVLAVLAGHAHQLGLQRVIWDHRLYDAQTPAGRPYSGPNPHTDHLHVEQTPDGARTLTYTTALASLTHALPTEDGDEPMLLIGRLAEPTDTAWWLLFNGQVIYLHHWDNVQALIDAGVPQIRLPDAVRARWPELR